MSANVCVIGADSMEPRLISEWIESGDLPNLAELRARGAWGDVLNPARFFSGASWPNFYTGLRPGRHGRYLQTHYDRQTCRHWPVRPSLEAAKPFWVGPGWRVKRTAALNLPYCSADERTNGLQMVDWGAHDRHVDDFQTVPADLADDVIARFGSDPVGDCLSFEQTPAALADLRERLLRRVRIKLHMTTHVLDSERWDLLVSVFDEPHCAGHRFWHLHDPSHALFDPELAKELGGTLKEVYVAVDRAAGEIIRRLDSDSTVLFVSSHGMGPAFDGNSVLDEVLRRLENLGPRSLEYRNARAQALARARTFSDRLPRVLQWALTPLRRHFGRRRLAERLEAEQRARKCFRFPTHDQWGGIRISVAGREADGLVQPGREYEEFVAKLIDDLHQLRDGRSGEPIVGEVERAAEIDHEGYAGELPDLIVRWARSSFAWVESPKVGRIEPSLLGGRTGDHSPEMLGMFFAVGPSVAPGRIETVRLEDFAPTIARLLGLPPGDTDGSAIPALGVDRVNLLREGG
jgi:predicted AlkP superfamily phosphohydrolase/phosphomutase